MQQLNLECNLAIPQLQLAKNTSKKMSIMQLKTLDSADLLISLATLSRLLYSSITSTSQIHMSYESCTLSSSRGCTSRGLEKLGAQSRVKPSGNLPGKI